MLKSEIENYQKYNYFPNFLIFHRFLLNAFFKYIVIIDSIWQTQQVELFSVRVDIHFSNFLSW